MARLSPFKKQMQKNMEAVEKIVSEETAVKFMNSEIVNRIAITTRSRRSRIKVISNKDVYWPYDMKETATTYVNENRWIEENLKLINVVSAIMLCISTYCGIKMKTQNHLLVTFAYVGKTSQELKVWFLTFFSFPTRNCVCKCKRHQKKCRGKAEKSGPWKG